jgi:predicted phosphodiesterase
MIAIFIATFALQLAPPEKRFIDYFHELGRKNELKPAPADPRWAMKGDPPLFTFALLADIHFSDNPAPITRAIRFLNSSRPAFVLIAGDNVSGQPHQIHQRHEQLKEIFDRTMEIPYFIVKGDNDARDFESVWGPSWWSFDCGGMHFAVLAQTNDWEAMGIGWTRGLGWLQRDLKAHSDQPALVLTHVPVWPPCSVSSVQLGAMLPAYSNVIATLAGHLHYDLSGDFAGITHLNAPGLGPHPDHPLKLLDVYPTEILVRTWDCVDGVYLFRHKWQRIAIPKGLKRAPPEDLKITNVRQTSRRETYFMTWQEPTFRYLEKSLMRQTPSELLATLQRHVQTVLGVNPP